MGRSMTRMDAAPQRLPEFDEARLDAVEAGVFAGIARERSARRRRRMWTGVGAAAAVVVIALAIVPAAGLLSSVSGTSGSAALAPEAVKPIPAPAAGAPDSSTSGGKATSGAANSAAGSSGSTGSSAQRDVVTTASATVRVDDVRASVTRIGAAAKAQGGYVEGMSIGQAGATALPSTGDGVQTTEPAPPVSGAWITVRVPAGTLDDVVTSLAGIGQVEASSINRQDVTDQTIDLQARVAASEASVARLTELMGKAGSVADLLAAESALADRQATLESERQQLKALDDQVAMSTLTVTVLPRAAAAAANPTGFGSGFVAGWNALVATFNGVVVGVAFLLPWIAVAAVVGLIVWGVLALRRRRARASIPPSE